MTSFWQTAHANFIRVNPGSPSDPGFLFQTNCGRIWYVDIRQRRCSTAIEPNWAFLRCFDLRVENPSLLVTFILFETDPVAPGTVIGCYATRSVLESLPIDARKIADVNLLCVIIPRLGTLW